eukprot:g24709.t1
MTSPDFPEYGSRRKGRIAEYIREMDDLAANLGPGPTYTLGFWGNSRFLDVPLGQLRGIPLVTPFDFEPLIGQPPVYAVLYCLTPAEAGRDGKAESRHLNSRKSPCGVWSRGKYMFRAAIWNSEKRVTQELFERLTGLRSSDRFLPESTERKRSKGGLVKNIFSAMKDPFKCCSGPPGVKCENITVRRCFENGPLFLLGSKMKKVTCDFEDEVMTIYSQMQSLTPQEMEARLNKLGKDLKAGRVAPPKPEKPSGWIDPRAKSNDNVRRKLPFSEAAELPEHTPPVERRVSFHWTEEQWAEWEENLTMQWEQEEAERMQWEQEEAEQRQRELQQRASQKAKSSAKPAALAIKDGNVDLDSLSPEELRALKSAPLRKSVAEREDGQLQLEDLPCVRFVSFLQTLSQEEAKKARPMKPMVLAIPIWHKCVNIRLIPAFDAPDLRYPIIEPSGAFLMTRRVTVKDQKMGTCIDWDSPERCPCGEHATCGPENFCEVKGWCPSLGDGNMEHPPQGAEVEEILGLEDAVLMIVAGIGFPSIGQTFHVAGSSPEAWRLGSCLALVQIASMAADFLMVRMYDKERCDAYYRCKVVETKDYSEMQERLDLVSDQRARAREMVSGGQIRSGGTGAGVSLGLGAGARGSMSAVLRGRNDGKDVEVRLVCRLQPKVHWVPEIYYKFGKDYGRGFLEKEASVDISEVVKKYTFSELVSGPEEAVEAIAEEINLRIADACAFHKIKIAKDETSIVFLDPEGDYDE